MEMAGRDGQPGRTAAAAADRDGPRRSAGRRDVRRVLPVAPPGRADRRFPACFLRAFPVRPPARPRLPKRPPAARSPGASS
ncbi:hypothetical protein BURPS668_0073 [Burkholderia pseudomallei 668]|nr:hypothetical protein BURPS668_0073 [Burkholderia pseudomallei 668]